jgi:hypothetical protein
MELSLRPCPLYRWMKEPVARKGWGSERTPEPMWTFWRKERYLATAGILNPARPGGNLVTTPTKLSRSPPCIAEDNSEGNHNFRPSTCLHGVHKQEFTFFNFFVISKLRKMFNTILGGTKF